MSTDLHYLRGMEVLFLDSELRDAIQLGRDFPGMTAPIRARACHMLHLLQAMPDLRSLKNWKSAKCRPGRGRLGIGRIALVDGHDFLVRVDESLSPPTITIIEINQEPRKAAMEIAHEDA